MFNKIIIEVKANADGISEEAIAQTLNYLKASGNRVGLIINFGKRRLEYKRVIFWFGQLYFIRGICVIRGKNLNCGIFLSRYIQ